MAAPAPSQPYMPHINGLRAIAILGILFYHMRADSCPAGYFGVDVFLVISGYLLFGSLLRPGAATGFHYGRYLLGKAWRILPSWAALTLATLLAAVLLMHPSRVAELRSMACAAACFSADFCADQGGSYFNPVSQQNPLLHLWYLSITQQLFLLAPLLVIPAARLFSRRVAAILLALLGLLSLAFYLLATCSEELSAPLLQAIGANSVYYHLIPRFWEVAAGAAICLLPALNSRPRLRQSLALLALVLMVAAFHLFETGSTAVYLSVLAAMLAVRYGGKGLAAQLLSLRPVQTLGTISFSLYLWHWPLMVFWKYSCMDSPECADEYGMLLASLLLAAAMWWLIERHRMPRLAGWSRLALSAGLTACLPLTFLAATQAQQFSLASDESYAQSSGCHWSRLLGNTQLIRKPCDESEADVLRGLEGLRALRLPNTPLRIGSAEVAPTFLLIGDSHAQHLYDALHEACLEAGMRGLYLNNTVAPYENLRQDKVGSDYCRWNPDIADTLLRYLNAHPEITHLLIAQCWKMRMEEGFAHDARSGATLDNRDARLAVTAPGLGAFCDRVQALGRQVVLLGETPRFPHPAPLDEWDRRRRLGISHTPRTMPVDEFEAKHAAPLSTMRQLAAEGRAQLIELAPALQVGRHYPAQHEGEFWYYDANHLTPQAARRVVRHLLPRLQAMQVPPQSRVSSPR